MIKKIYGLLLLLLIGAGNITQVSAKPSHHKPHPRPHHKPGSSHKPSTHHQSFNQGAQTPGTLNQAFGLELPDGLRNGLVTTHIAGVHGGSEISDLQVLSEKDDTIITIGNNGSGNTLIVASYDRNGDINTDFGDQGQIIFPGNKVSLSTVAMLPDFLLGDSPAGSLLINRSNQQNWQNGLIRQL